MNKDAIKENLTFLRLILTSVLALIALLLYVVAEIKYNTYSKIP